MNIAFSSRSAAALRQNDLANRRPPMPSLAITRGDTIATGCSRCRLQRSLRICQDRHADALFSPVVILRGRRARVGAERAQVAACGPCMRRRMRMSTRIARPARSGANIWKVRLIRSLIGSITACAQASQTSTRL
jgi:hypothetical protein